MSWVSWAKVLVFAVAVGIHFGQTEVEDFGVATVGYENVGGFDVAMDDAFAVGGVEAVGHVDGEGEEAFEVHGAAVDGVLERLAVEKFHGDEGFVVGVADFVDGADIGMIEGGGGFGFAAEAFESLRIVGEGFRKKLESHKAIEECVLRFVDDAHSAPAESFEDAEVRDGLSDERVWVGHGLRAILGRGRMGSQRGGKCCLRKRFEEEKDNAETRRCAEVRGEFG